MTFPCVIGKTKIWTYKIWTYIYISFFYGHPRKLISVTVTIKFKMAAQSVAIIIILNCLLDFSLKMYSKAFITT